MEKKENLFQLNVYEEKVIFKDFGKGSRSETCFRGDLSVSSCSPNLEKTAMTTTTTSLCRINHKSVIYFAFHAPAITHKIYK